MSTTTLNTKFQLRRDSYTNWHTTNPQLADGEPILVDVDGVYKLKIGDGNTYFDDLPYYGGSGSGSSAEKFVVHFTESNDTITADQSMVNIYAAKQADKTVVGQMQIEGALVEFNMPVCVSVEQTMMIIEFTAPVWIEVPELAILLGYAEASGNTFQGDEWQLSRSEISGGSSGSVNWDNVTNKPFYESTIGAAYDYTLDTTGAQVTATFDFDGNGTTLQYLLYRVGDVLNEAQVEGAIATIQTTIGSNSTEVNNEKMYDLTDSGGNNVGFCATGDTDLPMPLGVIINDANTSVDCTVNNHAFSATFTESGTYFAVIDLSSLLGGTFNVEISELTKVATTEVHKLDSKFYNGGVSSWNDLTDRPFYETVTEQGYNYEIDLSGNYVSGYFNIGDNIPCRFYRVGDSLTASQLLGAVGEIDNGEEVETHIIESNYIDEIEDNGDTVGLFVAGDMPYCLVINNANTTINYTGSNFGCSGTFASAGTYLFWLDLSSLYGEGTAVYNPSFVKANETSVVQLPDNFYKAPFIVEITQTTENNIETYSANATYSEILAALQAERPVYANINFNLGVLLVQAKALISGTINFSTMAYVENYIYAVKFEINNQDEVSANLTVFGSAQGVNF